MSKSNADFSRLISSKKYVLIPTEDNTTSNHSNQRKQNDSEISDKKREEKKRKRAERKKKYFDRKKAAKEKERAQKEEEEFTKQLNAKLSKSDNKNFEDLPEEYRKLIGGDFEHTHMVKGLDYGLLRQTKEKIAKQQLAEIENAYNNTNNNTNNNIIIYGDHDDDDDEEEEDEDENKNEDQDGDISMIMDIKSEWALNINKSMMKYYCKNNGNHEKNMKKKKSIKINPKFCNGMIYRFNMDDMDDMDDMNKSNSWLPTEIMRSQIGYGLVLDDFNEFENDNMSNKICMGYTPINVIKQIEDSLNNKHKNNNGNRIKKKRKFDEMNSEIADIVDEDNKKIEIDDDFDIFEDVGRDYVCDPEPKRRRVAFMTPAMEKINKLKQSYFEDIGDSEKDVNSSSSIKYEAASILKTSLNKAKIENAKEKRKRNMPALEKSNNNNNSNNNKTKQNAKSLRGQLLSSGFSNYDDDDDDIEDQRNYNSDDDDECKKTISAASANKEWKTIQEKYGDKNKISKKIKEKLVNPQNTTQNMNI